MVAWHPKWDRLPYCTAQLVPAGEYLMFVLRGRLSSDEVSVVQVILFKRIFAIVEY
jgi:hypothetical protein